MIRPIGAKSRGPTFNPQKYPIYLDYMATTPVDPAVIAEMVKYLGPDGQFGNPSSKTHIYGCDAAIAVEQARTQVAESIGASPEELVFTSGATEAINLALIGAARFYQRKGRHIVTVQTEHKAALDSCKKLEQEGFEVTYLPVEKDGVLNLSLLKEALRTDTIMVSVMHVNNEIGVIQDVEAIGDLLRHQGVIFHVDAAQSGGKLPLNLHEISVDLMSFSAHKNYGPKGVGALYIRHKPRIRLYPLSYGGGHEGGLRSGTLPTHQIVGMGMAFALSASQRAIEQARILKLRQKLWHGIESIPGVRLNGSLEQRIAGNLNVTFTQFPGEDLLIKLEPLAVSNTSACASASSQPSYVLKALGLSDEQAYRSVRFSMGRFTTEEEMDRTIEIIWERMCGKIIEVGKADIP